LARLKAVVAEAKRRRRPRAKAAKWVLQFPLPGERPQSAVEQSPSATVAPLPRPLLRHCNRRQSAPVLFPVKTPEQKVARLKAVVEEAKRRKEAGETAPAKSPAAVYEGKRRTGLTVTSPVAETAPVIDTVQTVHRGRKGCCCTVRTRPGETKEQNLRVYRP